MNFEDILKIIGCCILMIIIFVFVLWWSNYAYNDCLKVGHTKTYCVFNLG